jgi:hypothetical protein
VSAEAPSYPLPDPDTGDLQGAVAGLPESLLADAAEALAFGRPLTDEERAGLLALVHARPASLRLLRQREAARVVARERHGGRSLLAARTRAAQQVGVSEWTVRVRWDL